MDCTFVPGQRVVCVDDRLNTEYNNKPNAKYYYTDNLDGLTKDEIYTIRDVLIDEAHDVVVVRLVEISRPPLHPLDPDSVEAYYAAQRFRPLRDLTIFNEILRKANVPSVSDFILSDIDA